MKCACGQELHYSDPANFEAVQRFTDQLGEYVRVVIGGKVYMVQRHYIALHGLVAADAERLADEGIIKRVQGD